MNLNHLVISGNLTRDPETRTVGADRTVTNFTVAHNTRFKTQDGETREEVTFLECEAWGRPGELSAQYLTKGSLTVVEGALRQDNWTDKEGQKRSKLKLRVERVHFTPRSRDDAGAAEAESGSETHGEPAPAPRAAPGTRSETARPEAARSETAPSAARPAAKPAPRPARASAAVNDDPPF